MKVLIVLEDAHVFYVSTFGEAEYLAVSQGFEPQLKAATQKSCHGWAFHLACQTEGLLPSRILPRD
jgi:hypothetical protein